MILVAVAWLSSVALTALRLAGVGGRGGRQLTSLDNGADAACASATLVRDLIAVLSVVAVASAIHQRRRQHATPSRGESALHVCAALFAAVGAAWHVASESRCDVVLVDLRGSSALTLSALALYVGASVALVVQSTWAHRSAVSPVAAPLVLLLAAAPVVSVAQVLLAISAAVVLLLLLGAGVSKEDQLQFELAVSLFKRGVEQKQQQQR